MDDISMWSCRILGIAALSELVILVIMAERTYDRDDQTLLFMRRLGLCFIIFSLVELVKTAVSCPCTSMQIPCGPH
jgi:hypothetical protein